MNPTTDDYQTGALFGSAPNTSTLTANMLNQNASGPNDWQTVLTQGISNAALIGINGAVNNAVQSGELPSPEAVPMTTSTSSMGSILPLVMIAAVLYFVVR